jgi:hypothetical protein
LPYLEKIKKNTVVKTWENEISKTWTNGQDPILCTKLPAKESSRYLSMGPGMKNCKKCDILIKKIVCYLHWISKSSCQCKIFRTLDIILVTSGLPINNYILTKSIVESSLKEQRESPLLK